MRNWWDSGGVKELSAELFGDAEGSHATCSEVSLTYYGYPDMPKKGGMAPIADMQEIYLVLVWPRILHIEGLAPRYTTACTWPAQSGSAARDNGGWVHVFGLDYKRNIGKLLPFLPEQTVCLSVDIVYNGGVGAPGVDHDWSHAKFGISTEVKITDNISFIPGVYYQSSWEDSVNTEDELWCTLSLRYRF